MPNIGRTETEAMLAGVGRNHPNDHFLQIPRVDNVARCYVCELVPGLKKRYVRFHRCIWLIYLPIFLKIFLDNIRKYIMKPLHPHYLIFTAEDGDGFTVEHRNNEFAAASCVWVSNMAHLVCWFTVDLPTKMFIFHSYAEFTRGYKMMIGLGDIRKPFRNRRIEVWTLQWHSSKGIRPFKIGSSSSLVIGMEIGTLSAK